MAGAAALKEIAIGEFRRILDHNRTFEGTDVAIGDSAISYGQISRENAPRWRGPELILDIDEAGITAKFQIQACKIARYCERERIVTSSDAPVGTREADELQRDGRRRGEPMDVEAAAAGVLRPECWWKSRCRVKPICGDMRRGAAQ